MINYPYFPLANCRMVIEWRERGHEDIENQVIDNTQAMEALCQCSLRNVFELSNMQAQKRLLQLIIIY
jgi:hypothetical protein